MLLFKVGILTLIKGLGRECRLEALHLFSETSSKERSNAQSGYNSGSSQAGRQAGTPSMGRVLLAQEASASS